MADVKTLFLAVIKGDTSQAVSEFDKLGKSVEKSVGKSATTMDKFKAVTKASLAEAAALMKSPAGIAAGTAAVGYAAIKAADRFSSLGKTALDVSKATGLTVEQASRWIAVADDAGVGADTLAAGIGRISKTLDSGKWEKYGIATRDASGQARDANAVLLDALGVLNATTNETERARIGTELFGKGFASLAPLIGKSRSEYEQMLASVSEGQVITEGEAAAGEKWRLAMDNLSDSLGDVALAVGELVVELAPLIDGVAELLQLMPKALDITGISDSSADSISRFNTRLNETEGSAVETAIAFTDMSTEALRNSSVLSQWGFIAGAAFDDTSTEVDLMKTALENMADVNQKSMARTVLALEGVIKRAEEGDAAAIALAEGWDINSESLAVLYDHLGLTKQEIIALADSSSLAAEAGYLTNDALTGIGADSVTGGISMAADNLNEVARKAAIASWEVTTLEMAFGDLLGRIDQRQALLNVQDSFDRVTQATQDYYIAVATGADDTEQKYRAMQEAILGATEDGVNYAMMLGDIPPAKVTEFLALVDEGKYDEAEALLNGLAQDRVVGFRPQIVAGTGAGGLLGGQIVLRPDDALADGGPAKGGRPYLVGERGPELFVPASSGTVVPNGAMGGTTIMNVTIANPIVSGEQLANELAAYTRRNGNRWLVAS
jgi:hypothetical protein